MTIAFRMESHNADSYNGDARLYKLVPPVMREEYNSTTCEMEQVATEYVIVSAVNNGYAHETYIFPATADGEVISWLEMAGSEQGHTNHRKVLQNAGWGIG